MRADSAFDPSSDPFGTLTATSHTSDEGPPPMRSDEIVLAAVRVRQTRGEHSIQIQSICDDTSLSREEVTAAGLDLADRGLIGVRGSSQSPVIRFMAT